MLIITTDHKFRDFLYGSELTDKEREDFEYIDPEEIGSRDFFRYRGHIYDPGDFLRTGQSEWCPFKDKWDGYISDSYFSGVLIKYSEDGEQYQVGTYYS